jgi:hypothetical protein
MHINIRSRSPALCLNNTHSNIETGGFPSRLIIPKAGTVSSSKVHTLYSKKHMERCEYWFFKHLTISEQISNREMYPRTNWTSLSLNENSPECGCAVLASH